MIKQAAKSIFRLTKKYKKVIIAAAVVYALWFLFLGFLGGWLMSKGTLSSLPEITKDDKVLILAPHIDDEVIATGGVIEQAVENQARIKIVYMTNGDDNLGSVLGADKLATVDPNDFITLGETRMEEAKNATQNLGLKNENLVFLGYPDKGLTPMLNNYYGGTPYASQSTKFNYNPYKGTFREKQNYIGANVVEDLSKIISSFQPTMIFVSHPRDQHPDHRATYRFMEKITVDLESKPKIYTYLVHSSLYPPEKKLIENKFLYPPKKLFTKEGWYSFDLSDEQIKIKLNALNKNFSQTKTISFTGTLGGFLRSFVKKNEIFELMD